MQIIALRQRNFAQTLWLASHNITSEIDERRDGAYINLRSMGESRT
jgi:hypothetical protein